MKSIVEIEIHAPQAEVAELFDNPDTFPQWMDDLERIEPVGESSGMQSGSTFRLVPKKGTGAFVGRIIKSEPPHRAQLALDASTVSVSVTGTFVRVSDEETKLVSEETFRFKGLLGHLLGFLGQHSIKRAHRRHMESFKRFAESQ